MSEKNHSFICISPPYLPCCLPLSPGPVPLASALDQRGRVRKNAQRGAPAQPTAAPHRGIVCLWITFPDSVHKKAANAHRPQTRMNACFPDKVQKLSTMHTAYDERYV